MQTGIFSWHGKHNNIGVGRDTFSWDENLKNLGLKVLTKEPQLTKIEQNTENTSKYLELFWGWSNGQVALFNEEPKLNNIYRYKIKT